MKTFYRKIDNSPSVFEDSANISDYPDFSETPVTLSESTIYDGEKRNALLAETDWWGLSDRTMTDEQAAYRQALRDMPEQDSIPNVVWPVKPST